MFIVNTDEYILRKLQYVS